MAPPLIMIVNDDHLVLALFSLLLRKAGYRSVIHQRSTDVDDRVMQLQPALLILDIHMERRESGWQVLDGLRSHPATQQLPVLIYSGQTNLPERVQERGDPHCAVLPFGASVDGLLTCIRQWLPVEG